MTPSSISGRRRPVQPSLLGLGLVLMWVFLLSLPSASAQKAFAGRYSNTAVAGDIVLIGNVNYYCLTVSPATAAQITNCNTARSGGVMTNNTAYMGPIDTDSSALTTNSSSATLSLGTGSSLLFAGLYWNGISSSATNRSTVLFAPPSGVYSTLTATAANVAVVTASNAYQSFVDVTAQVQAGGSGKYSVGNVASTAGTGNWAGWTLVVAYKNTTLATRNLAVFDGLQSAGSAASPVDITVSGFLTPSSGTVRSTIGVVAYDGDRGSQEGAAVTPPGSLQFGATTGSLSAVYNPASTSSSQPNSQNDVFDSTITALGTTITTSNPAFTNTMGLDIDTLTPITALPNGSTSAVVRVIGTSSDTIYPGIITLATEIFVPNIKDSLTKSVTDVNGGVLVPGDVLQYELVIKNSGNDGAKEVTLTDPLPSGVTFVPGSLVITGTNAGTKTDAAGDDQADYVAGTRTVNFRLGTGANASVGGLILPNEETRARFQVTVNAATPGGTSIDNTGTVNYKTQTLGTAVSDTSDSDPLTAGDQPAHSVVAGPDLTIDKAHTGNAVASGNATFTLTVTNPGGAPTFGTVTVGDTLPGALSAVSISGPGWTCTVSPLQCTRSDVLTVGASYPAVTLVTKVASGTPTGTVTNTASVQNPAEGSVNTGNNTDADVLTIQGLPVVSLSKTVRNVTTGGTAGTSISARPGQTLEYCVSFSNTGGDAANFVVQDDAPGNTGALTGAYGAGLGVQLTLATTSPLTSVADADAASLIAGHLKYTHGTLLQGQSGRVCFQVSVN